MPLTEGWVTQYLEIVITLLVFALGLPALILQLAAPEEARVILSQRLKLVQRITWFLGFAALICVLTFIWIHPYSSEYQGASDVPSSQSKVLVSPWKWLENTAGNLFHSPAQYSNVITITMTLVVIVVFFFVLVQIRGYRRDGLINNLNKKCQKSVRDRGIIPEVHLMDLIYLGEQGDPGHAKTEVLDSFDDLAVRLQKHSKYAGEGLAELVRGIEHTLVSGAKVGNSKNFHHANRILEGILLRLRSRDLSAAPDAAIVLSTLERLGTAALTLGSKRASIGTLQVIAAAAEGPNGAFKFASETLFKIGTAALTDGEHFLVAVAALSKLQALAEQRIPLKGEVAADLLGLLAHFCANGRTARRHALSILDRMEGSFDSSLEDCIEAAIEHQYWTAQFDTADKLIELLEGFQQDRQPPKAHQHAPRSN